MTKTCFMIAAAAALLFSASALNADVVTEPQKVPDAKLKTFLEQKCAIDTGMGSHRFEAKGSYLGGGIMGATMKGTWKVKKGAVIVKATGTGGPCGEGEGEDDDCGKPWPADFRWDKVRVDEKSGLVIIENKGGGSLFYLCQPGSGCDKGKEAICYESGEPILIRPGNKDRALYDKVRAYYAKTDGSDPVAEGKQAKNPRETTEIWFQDKQVAEHVAKKLKKIVGPVTPQLWTWGGPYGVIVIVGQSKAK